MSDGVTVHTSTELAPGDAERLAELESTIDRGLTTFVEVGAALAEIRERRLYRETHGTFEDYCRERWQMSRSYAHRIIESAQVVANVQTLPIGNTAPATESQARPLAKLEPEQQREVWREAVETAPEGKVTAKHVSATVERITKPDAAPAPPKGPEYTRRTVSTRQLLAFVGDAIRAADAAAGWDPKDMKKIQTNSFMVAGLQRTWDLCEQIISYHVERTEDHDAETGWTNDMPRVSRAAQERVSGLLGSIGGSAYVEQAKLPAAYPAANRRAIAKECRASARALQRFARRMEAEAAEMEAGEE